jgi:alpha-2-macroglobulin
MKAVRFLHLLFAVLLSLSGFGVLPALAGSPFYLTAARSFSNTEKPELRLDYTSTNKPMLIRVLRPKNLERFLDGQLQISRSYEEPTTELNPGHYFVSGLNKVESPLKTFREMLDAKFRRSFKDTAFHKAILDASRGDVASLPEQIIQGAPEGFALVREYYLDLQYGGEGVSDLGWWFADSAWREDSYKIRKVILDPLPDGIYLVQAVQAKTEAQCLMQVSSLAVQVKQSTEQLVVRVITRELDPVPGAAISYRDGRGKWFQLPQKTNQLGETAFSNPQGILDGKLVIKVETPDKRQALADTDFLPAVTSDNSVFVITDRPIFKPGESFFYKGIVRALEKGELKVPDFARKQADVTLIRADGAATDLHAVTPVTDFGSFSGAFTLDDAQLPGLYRLVAEIDRKPYGGEFRVRDYVKPTFYLELIDRGPTVVAGERLFIKFKAKRYSGGAPKDVKYEVFLYRKKFETPPWVVEAGAGLSAAADYHGEVRSASALTEPQRIFSSIEARLVALDDKYVTNTWDSAPNMDEAGEASFTFEVPKIAASSDQEWIYTLMVRALDRAGSQAVLTENLYVTLSEAQPTVQFSDAIAKVGDKGLALWVRSTYPDGKLAPRGGGVVYVALEKGRIASKELVKLPFTTDDQGVCRLALPELASSGRLTAVATLETLDGKALKRPATSQPAVMIVGGAQGELVLENQELELYTANTVLSPGEKAKVLALLPADWGKSEAGTIWETLSGTKIFDTRPSAFQGRSRWFEVEARPEYGTGFYHTVTVPMSGGKYREQTLGFRIIPWTRRLNVTVFPERDEAEPLKPFQIAFEVKDAKGTPAADTELAVTIVDRAVYAVQGELRPGVFDFFYPLPRLNLATFYSDELQGYGYAALLKKPNFKLGALKSQSKPTKKSMRDTAGWFPHIVTDADGRAAITVDLPANVTEWLVTVVASDKDGRVGESKGKFRTVADVSIEALAPQFLREGEEAAIQLKTVNHLSRPVSVKSRIALAGQVQLKEGQKESEFRLEGRGEQVRALRLEATGAGGAATIEAALEAAEAIHIGGTEEFDIPLKPSAMTQVFSGTSKKNTLTTNLPPTGKVGELKVQVSSGLLGAALNAATVLVSYPFGCTEQLVHTTIPNLVLMDIVKRAGISPNELGPLAAVLTKAERNGSLGIKKIIQNQKTEGGFGLWPADPRPSIPATVTALYALKFAADLKVEGASRVFNRGLDWLARQFEKEREGSKTALSGYELSRIAEIGSYAQPYKQEIVYVEELQQTKNPAIEDLIYALKMFAAHQDQDWDRFSQHFNETTVKEDLVEKLQEALTRFEPKGYWKTAAGEQPLFQTLGFGFGAPYLVSAGLGVLKGCDALPEELETRLKQMLLSSMKNGYWTSTFDTAQVIFNTREILSEEAAVFVRERDTGSRRIVVRAGDGTEFGELSRIPSGFVGTFVEPGNPGTLSEIHLTGMAADDVAYSTIKVEVPYAALKPYGHGLRVERSFLRITPQGREPLDISRPLPMGTTVVSEVRVRRDPLPDTGAIPSRFLVVEDGIPSLAQAIDEDETYLADAKIQPKDETYWSSIKETRRYPEKTVRVARVEAGGELRVYQVWRVTFAGRAAIPPARAFDMYDESLHGNTEAVRVAAD